MVRDYYKCDSCSKKFYKVKKALEHKISTKHKILYLFDKTVREAFATNRSQ